jgi:hypothetical protein
MEEPMNRKNIPKTDSIQELAHFWDTYDLTDFEGELEEVSEPVFDALVSIQLAPEEFEVIETLAKSRGISPGNLIREWVVERITSTPL